jgi:hypothetical protein
MSNTSWAVVLCKFSDQPTETRPPQYYKDLFTSIPGGPVATYWRDVTHGVIDTTGSQVFGWFTMPHSTAELAGLVFPGQRSVLVQWGKDAAVANGVNLGAFGHFIVFMNYGVDSGEAGNGVVIHHENSALCEVAFICHEMGHDYGLPHSWSAAPDREYGDGWDLMSFNTTTFDWTINFEGASGAATVGLNARNLDVLGALPHSRVWSPPGPDFSSPVELAPGSQFPLPGDGYLALQVNAASTRPARPSGNPWYVEYRAKVGWDQAIPADSITVRERRISSGDLSFLNPTMWSSFQAGGTYVLPEPQVFVNVASIDTAQHRASLRVWDLPEGALRKEDSAPEVYLIRNRCKTWVESPDVLLKVLGRSWADVRSVPDGGLAGVPDGTPLVPFWGAGRLFPGAYPAGTLVAYDPNTMDWWLAAPTAGGLRWTQAGNTAGFGQVGDGRPFWTGDFTGTGHTQVLFYYPGDQNWWVGTVNGTSLSWALWGNTSGFGNTVHDPTWTGNFTGQGRTEVLFYSPGDYNWWLGTDKGATQQWSLAGNTAGFGQVGDGRPFWVGDFTGVGRSQILFYYPGDQNWWVGTVNGTSLSWALWGNTSGFGNTVHDPTWTGNFTGQGRTEVLFYSPGDYNWWLGTSNAGRQQWALVGQGAG